MFHSGIDLPADAEPGRVLGPSAVLRHPAAALGTGWILRADTARLRGAHQREAAQMQAQAIIASHQVS